MQPTSNMPQIFQPVKGTGLTPFCLLERENGQTAKVSDVYNDRDPGPFRTANGFQEIKSWDRLPRSLDIIRVETAFGAIEAEEDLKIHLESGCMSLINLILRDKVRIVIPMLTNFQKSCLLGLVLGGASIYEASQDGYYSSCFIYKTKDEELLKLIAKIFNELYLGSIPGTASCYCTKEIAMLFPYRHSTRKSPEPQILVEALNKVALGMLWLLCGNNNELDLSHLKRSIFDRVCAAIAKLGLNIVQDDKRSITMTEDGLELIEETMNKIKNKEKEKITYNHAEIRSITRLSKCPKYVYTFDCPSLFVNGICCE